ncbi:bifunctional phosphoribosylaminoimidazolecarboxamide formyltransferase/IMP cyclohydrolase [Buchnera aphidicola]|uniref:Bifunctional purine biosynthesis protein PurH n=1 Tax=Buchnera aphidicola subsp. Baizongia pistaciae (strain Bp) TaxID=224915 RepID=PUR9_BUCBP|nr:bifunctional phosphoribosylaminoimidazolecarboxamide formyltransferase/IMP cyclohydrolase [Buchnera aphidicola]Q89B23.1 RecName: Full=Bifunctional purine biosynthesis protein PurH; Includes: RecName: Full=Phosphoribosylaminoimidazolecarboxamide formyltransferase; AltName: Full=AICAR transformylase; Includes: RecName: Full=IMP cyclohydrolase; AltName: Full=ATIC; AltName: Full=IMP synthase; AltName: Full=Inosinicase [Buchnera aphidicola str. Bp (Baizongia pistaciae)]
MTNRNVIKNVLISVSDTSNIIEFSKSLISKNIKLFATKGTANFLKKNNIYATDITNYTNFPEIMNGRIKTLHHKIYASILAQPKHDKKTIEKYNIILMDIVVINFYPFEEASNNTNLHLNDIIEHIDIGGPAIVRAAAKNYKNVLVVTQPNLYQSIVNEMNLNNNIISETTKLKFATIAFKHTMNYDNNIYQYLSKKNKTVPKNTQLQTLLPSHLTINFKKKQDLCYGENKQQQASWYTNTSKNTSGRMKIKQLQGKILSYNNLSDIHLALSCIHEFNKTTCAIIKHGNPCGVATAKNNDQAYKLAYETDPISAFGGIIVFNQKLNDVTARKIIKTQFSEIILAPDFTQEAKKIFDKKPNLRIIKYDPNYNYLNYNIDIKSIYGDILVQSNTNSIININQWDIVSKKRPNEQEINDAKFALRVVKHLKSNSIVLIKNQITISIGSGQTSRIDATKIAIYKANNNNISLNHTTLASDAFFPFSDSIDLISKSGITCIVQPGGSIRDNEIIMSANKYNISMIFTKQRYFKH